MFAKGNGGPSGPKRPQNSTPGARAGRFPAIDPEPIKKSLQKIDSFIDAKKGGLERKEKDMDTTEKIPASSKFLIAFFAFLGGEAFKFVWKKFGKKSVPSAAGKGSSFAKLLTYSLLSSLASTAFSSLGCKLFAGRKR